MEQLIERYIYDVVRRLPEHERDEVRLELMSNISDMLPENPDNQAINTVLTEMGAPAKLAEQYRQEPRYLISPGMYDLYISVLKKVVIAAGLVFMCISLFSGTMDLNATSLSGIIQVFIRAAVFGAVEGALQGAFWVTLGFVIADRGIKHRASAWTVANLPKMPNLAPQGRHENSLSRASVMTGMLLTMFFACALILIIRFNLPVFVIARRSVEVISPFSQAAMNRSVPFIGLLAVISVAVSGLKLFQGRWSWVICGAVIVQNIITVGILAYMAHWKDLLSQEFTEFARINFNGSADVLRVISTPLLPTVLTVVFIIFAALDIFGAVKNTVGKRDVLPN